MRGEVAGKGGRWEGSKKGRRERRGKRGEKMG